MPWDLSEFDRKRLEKGRRLLQESEEHRGCRDLQVGHRHRSFQPSPLAPQLAAPCCVQLYVEGMDLTVQLHRIFLDDSGQRRQGLTAQEKLQVLGSGDPWLTLLLAFCFHGCLD